MHPPACGEWEYVAHPRHKKILPARCDLIYISAKADSKRVDRYLEDTRRFHFELFSGLTLPKQDYLAGHYRGEAFTCLQYRPAVIGYIGPDGRYVVVHRGHAADEVDAAMTDLHKDIAHVVQELLAERVSISKGGSEVDFRLHLSDILAKLLQLIFTIHPYANGNGHMGRMLIAMVLLKVGVKPKKWTLDKRPPYDEAVQQHRQGNCQPLIDLILKAIGGS